MGWGLPRARKSLHPQRAQRRQTSQPTRRSSSGGGTARPSLSRRPLAPPINPRVVISAPFTLSSGHRTPPPDARPPPYGERSIRVARAPLCAAATAAERPVGPPPTTSTSLRSTTGAERVASATVGDGTITISFVGAPRPAGPQPRGGLRRALLALLPRHDAPLGEADHREEHHGPGRGDAHRRVEERRAEVVGGLDDQGAQPQIGADPLADDRPQHGGGRGDLQRREEKGQGA